MTKTSHPRVTLTFETMTFRCSKGLLNETLPKAFEKSRKASPALGIFYEREIEAVSFRKDSFCNHAGCLK